MTNSINQISTSALAKRHNITPNEMFAHFLKIGLIEKKDNLWALTNQGIKIGGKFVKSKDYGKYITWPDNLKFDDIEKEPFLTATAIGKTFNLSASKINYIFSELGWAKKALKGWKITIQGKKQGALQDENKKSGVPYIKWPQSILNSKIFVNSVQDFLGNNENIPTTKDEKKEVEFRDKFVAKHRTTDGHFVRSKAEMIIDNWLYMAGIVHAYERRLPIEEDVYSDFYIPKGNVYIEYWGFENNKKYIERKKRKIELYQKYDFNLIELEDKDVLNLDDILPRLLLKHEVPAY